MIVLALDTALDACSVAVVRDGRPLAVLSEPMARGHQERLAPMVDEAMRASGAVFSELDRVVVTVGPGSFTGLRVGLGFAKAMALALDRPCVGVGTLEALAATAATAADVLAVAAVDAHRGQLYVQAFRGDAQTLGPSVMAVADAVAALQGLGADARTAVVGSGAALLEGIGADAPVLAPTIDPVGLARLGAARPEPNTRAEPLYLREPDARTIAQRALA